jgi:hypothetical protein
MPHDTLSGQLPQRPVHFSFPIPLNHPQLLQGLDNWLALGLLTEDQVRNFCEHNLSCELPEPQPEIVSSEFVNSPQKNQEPPTSNSLLLNSPTPNSELQTPNPELQTPNPEPRTPNSELRTPNSLNRLIQGLMTELSLRWIQFLGTFWVIVSSGVLAANLWQRSNPSVQYLVLLTYTVAFFAASHWCGRRSGLRLTALTLQTIAGILIPVNFWAMDDLGLRQTMLGGLTMAIATLVLIGMVFTLAQGNPQRGYSLSSQILLLSLGLLHWGWANPAWFAQWPLTALYVGLAMLLLFNPRKTVITSSSGSVLALGSILLLSALAILLVRAIFIAGVEVSHLGLAIALTGWLFAGMVRRETWLNLSPSETANRDPASGFLEQVAEWVGAIFLGLGWLVTVATGVRQALLVSLLGLGFWQQRLTRFWLRRDWLVMVAIALQLFWLLWRLIPLDIRNPFLHWAAQLMDIPDYPYALHSLGLFPYVLGLLASAVWFARRGQPKLANFSDVLALILGTFLLILSLVSSPLSTLTLALATGASLAVTFRSSRQHLPITVILSHSLGIITLASAVHWAAPQLSNGSWAIFCLSLAVLQWGWTGRSSLALSWNTPKAKYWRNTAWRWGLILVGWSYWLLFKQTYGLIRADRPIDPRFSDPAWGLVWLMVPLSLTLMAMIQPQQRTTRVHFSSLALFLVQGLTLPIASIRIPTLILATGIMAVNSSILQQVTVAITTIGLGLITLTLALADGVLGFPPIKGVDWFLVAALLINLFWFSTWALTRFSQRPRQLLGRLGQLGQLRQIYSEAADYWGLVLISLQLVALTCHALFFATTRLDIIGKTTLAAGLTLGALIYRNILWLRDNPRSFLNDPRLYGLAWALEIFLLEALQFCDRSALSLTIAHLSLAFITQFLGDWWINRNPRIQSLSSVQVIPLGYAIIGGLSRWGYFNEWTGFSSLAIAFILISIGRRKPSLNWLTYLGLITFTLSTYELLGYVLRSQPGATQLLAYATLTTVIAYCYRLLTPWLRFYLRLSGTALHQVAHGHWGLATAFLWMDLFSSAGNSPALSLLKVITGLLLTAYALAQGRGRTASQQEQDGGELVAVAENSQRLTNLLWVYAGFCEAGAIAFYGWSLATPWLQIFLSDWLVAIVTPLCTLCFLLPWQTWGWSLRPWRQLGVVLPIGLTLITWNTVTSYSLIIAAISYIALTSQTHQIRLTYVSWIFLDLGIWRWLAHNSFSDPLWYSLPIGLFVIWIAQFDPALLQPRARQNRHGLRLIGSGLICGIALLPGHEPGLLAGSLSFATIFAGLILRIRAFLYVGTLTFLGNVFYQSIVLVKRQSLVKWAIGLIAGIALLWIAATFETRREQIRLLLQDWAAELETWD